MEGFRTFEKVKIRDDSEEKTYIGIRLRPVANGDGYYVESIQSSLKNAFITNETYQSILAAKDVTIHIP